MYGLECEGGVVKTCQPTFVLDSSALFCSPCKGSQCKSNVNKVNIWLIVGSVVGVVALAAIALTLYLCRKQLWIPKAKPNTKAYSEQLKQILDAQSQYQSNYKSSLMRSQVSSNEAR